MSLRNQEQPEFAQALRGYDRVQVDGYLERLREYTIEVEDRALNAESNLAEQQQAFADLQRQLAAAGGGELPHRLAHILDLAREEADEIRVRAHKEADEVLAKANAAAEKVRTRARAEAQRTVADAAALRAALERQVNDLEDTRHQVTDRLSELATHLKRAIDAHRADAQSTEPTRRLPARKAANG
jgi:DivIVA domain-containing protein